jgi:uncharacterized tellurite resistance protein B-like protein
MHILIAFITALASLLYALERLGIDIGWINPWAWKRRRQWRKQYHANPAFSLTKPMEAAALLLTSIVKVDGDISSDEKNELLRIFEEEFNQTAKQASDLFVSSTYLLNSSRDVLDRPGDVLAPSLHHFSDLQKRSTIELLKRLSEVGGDSNQTQREFIIKVSAALEPEYKTSSW